MNAELIKLSRKAAKEWAGTDGYNQASQLINPLQALFDVDGLIVFQLQILQCA